MNIICVQTLAFDHFVFRLKTEVWMRKMNARALFIAGHKPTNSSFYSTLPLRSGPGCGATSAMQEENEKYFWQILM